jgi:hypothetical protein
MNFNTAENIARKQSTINQKEHFWVMLDNYGLDGPNCFVMSTSDLDRVSESDIGAAKVVGYFRGLRVKA